MVLCPVNVSGKKTHKRNLGKSDTGKRGNILGETLDLNCPAIHYAWEISNDLSNQPIN